MGESAVLPAQHESEARLLAAYALRRAEASGRSIEDNSVVVVWVDNRTEAAGTAWLRVRIATPGHMTGDGGGLALWRQCIASTDADMVPVICIFKTGIHMFRIQRGRVFCSAA